MIKLTRINEKEIIINIDIIESIEEVPHTVISTVQHNKYVVKESADEIINKVIEFKQKITCKDSMRGS